MNFVAAQNGYCFKSPTSMWGKKKGVENEEEKDL
jgi:hypothetical protein